MRIDGEWYPCADGVRRPIVRAELLASDGSTVEAHFLVDTGADRTVLSRTVLDALGPRSDVSTVRLAGLGGVVETVLVRTEVRFTREDWGQVVFRGIYAAVTGF